MSVLRSRENVKKGEKRAACRRQPHTNNATTTTTQRELNRPHLPTPPSTSPKTKTRYCKAGKDRTGLLAALLLLSSGVPRDLVLDDYHASDAFHAMGLAGLEREPGLAALDKAVFERAPRASMEYALGFLDRITAGGGAAAYLEGHGFGRLAQARLAELLLVTAPSEEEAEGARQSAGRAAKRQAKL